MKNQNGQLCRFILLFFLRDTLRNGSSAMKVMGGLVGAVVVRPLASQNIPSSITAGDEHVLVVTNVIATQTVDTEGGARFCTLVTFNQNIMNRRL